MQLLVTWLLSRKHFCPENVNFFICCIYSSSLKTRVNHGIKKDEPWSDCSLGSSLIWVHIVCNIGYLKTLADERSRWQKSWLAGKIWLHGLRVSSTVFVFETFNSRSYLFPVIQVCYKTHWWTRVFFWTCSQRILSWKAEKWLVLTGKVELLAQGTTCRNLKIYLRYINA